jgi:NodT family efflux transporter outer membrane factor (OMF) lipoprotein
MKFQFEIFFGKRRAMYHFSCLPIATATITTAIVLAGCAVGPDFRSPQVPAVGSYTAAALPEKTAGAPGTGGASQRFIPGREIPAEWWMVFHSEALDRLVRAALADSPTLAQAQARIVEAQENRRAQFGARFPSADANLSVSREKASGALFGQPDTTTGAFALINASVNVSYTVDLFGALRRQLEALDSQIEYQQFQLEDAHLTLTSTLVVTAVKEASLRSQIRATREIVALQEKQLTMVERRLDLGGVSLPDVLAQRTQLAQTRATLPPLERDLEQTRHQLAALVGKLPGEAVLPEFELAGLKLPEELPVSLPSSLVRQRPDIRAAEALLHAEAPGWALRQRNSTPRSPLPAVSGR